MTDKSMVEALAKIEGLEFQSTRESSFLAGRYEAVRPPQNYLLPNYFIDFNPLHRIVEGMTKTQRRVYSIKLAKIMCGIKNYLHHWELANATERQMAEAIIRTYGKYEKIN